MLRSLKTQVRQDEEALLTDSWVVTDDGKTGKSCIRSSEVRKTLETRQERMKRSAGKESVLQPSLPFYGVNSKHGSAVFFHGPREPEDEGLR